MMRPWMRIEMPKKAPESLAKPAIGDNRDIFPPADSSPA
jgi:hypothetical protein